MPAWKDAEKEFEKFFENLGKRAYVARLSDTATAKATGGGFIGAQPSDYIVTLDGMTHYAEVKSSQNPTFFPFSNIKRGQKIAARRSTTAGGTYLFYIKNLNTNRWYCVPAQVIVNHSAKSIKWVEIEQYRMEI